MPKSSKSAAGAVSAAVDVGSNSVHLLVARVRAGNKSSQPRLEPLDDRSDLIGLGDAVHELGVISPEWLGRVLESLHGMDAVARRLGATDLTFVGTEPLRRASNGDELAAAARRYLHTPLHVLTERQEAQLTFVGVTGGRSPRSPLAVVDIGGGSTEIALHRPGHDLVVVPLRIGSARLTGAVVRNDPPSRAELSALTDAARAAVVDAPWPSDGSHRELGRVHFVGGTATNVARLGQLERRHLDQDLETLAGMPTDAVVSHFGVRPRRARQLPAGVAIVAAILDELGLESADVSDASLRDGAILARAILRDRWLDDLDELTG